METAFTAIISGIYLGITLLLFAYNINYYYFIYLAIKYNQNPEEVDIPFSGDLPKTTVQLPIYNELYVAERLINQIADLDYPRDLLEIQVLDDSNDETTQLIENTVRKLKAQGIPIEHYHRTNRTGFKAGALAEGLKKASGEFIAIFDADFLPESDFLRKVLPHFRNPKIAFVQTRWDHLNRNFSLLTFLQSLAIDTHFIIEQVARHSGGYWFNFNGTAGIWRRSAIQDAGGWKDDTLTEDLDLSYRAMLKGWNALYLRDVKAPAELPVSFNAYRKQQHRWARGSLECAIKYLPIIWKSTLPASIKIESSFHLTGYATHLLMFLMCSLYPIVALLNATNISILSFFTIGLIFNMSLFAPSLAILTSQIQLGRKNWRLLPSVFLSTAFGFGMMLNTVRAALQIIPKKINSFERTPKFGITQKGQIWKQKKYQLTLDPIVYYELAYILFNIGTICIAILNHYWSISIFATVFCIGLLLTSSSTLVQTFSANRQFKKQHLKV
jgi:cellulose synthase/poly-beta-1,6-N-acetylglucosamine synthase-like glycosyltransferase